MIFQNRIVAAELLADCFQVHLKTKPLILGIPRGAVPMAQIIADRLGGDLDVVLVHKIGAPSNPEFAIGSVSEYGTVYLSNAVKAYSIPESYIREQVRKELSKLRFRRRTYSPIRSPISPSGRVSIIVDDGIATGATVLSAIRAVRSQGPEKIIVAAPVASTEAVELIGSEADEVVILQVRDDLSSVSQFYDDFSQVTDEEVMAALSGSSQKAA